MDYEAKYKNYKNFQGKQNSRKSFGPRPRKQIPRDLILKAWYTEKKLIDWTYLKFTSTLLKGWKDIL